MASGGPGRVQQWLLFRAPEVLVALGVLVFTAGGVGVLVANPVNINTAADESYGPDAPMQTSNVVLALGLFLGSAALTILLGWQLWKRRSSAAG